MKWGVVIGLLIIAPLLVPIGIRTFRRDSYAERWGRYEYKITRSGSFVFEGMSYRKENPESLDEIAQRLLVEWFDSEGGASALVYDSHHERYRCIVFLQEYGAGEAWGR